MFDREMALLQQLRDKCEGTLPLEQLVRILPSQNTNLLRNKKQNASEIDVGVVFTPNTRASSSIQRSQ